MSSKIQVRSTPDIQVSKINENQIEKRSYFSIVVSIYDRVVSRLLRYGPIELARNFWRLSMIQDRQGDVISPLYLAFFPLMLFFPSGNRKIYLLILFSIVYFALGVNLWGKYNRYIIPIFPVLSVITVRILQNIQLEYKRLGGLCKIIGFSMCLLYFPAAIHGGINHFPPAFGIIAQSTYLDRHFPGSYDVAQYVNSKLPETASLLLIGEYGLFLFERDYFIGGRWGVFMQYQDFEDPDSAYTRLKSLGVTHVLLNKQSNSDSGGINSGYADTDKYIENFENKYLQDLYQNSNVFLYEIKKM
jgi:hypothetical protein